MGEGSIQTIPITGERVGNVGKWDMVVLGGVGMHRNPTPETLGTIHRAQGIREGFPAVPLNTMVQHTGTQGAPSMHNLLGL